MEDSGKEAAALNHIQHRVAQEHRLFELASRTSAQDQRLTASQVSLDQCWDLLRQRRALRETGGALATAALRSPEVVEKCIG